MTGNKPASLQGLSDAEVVRRREEDGANCLPRSGNLLLANILSAVREPMFILLVVGAILYMLLDAWTEAFTMLGALAFVAGLDVFQNFRSQKAIKALGRITARRARVLRNGIETDIDIEDLVSGDIVFCGEGDIIPADGRVLTSGDLSVNEAVLSGESWPVDKTTDDAVFQGTMVIRGYGYIALTAVGAKTVLSGIGRLMAGAGRERTPMQIRVGRFVRTMVLAGSVAFFFVWIWHAWVTGSIWQGLLQGLTMAMSLLPEEIPVALSTFMALGAYRLLRFGIIARSPATVETLGSATVICLDKTGTLTRNLMQLGVIWDFRTNEEVDMQTAPDAREVLEYAMWASEEAPFDPMELSLHANYQSAFPLDERSAFRMAVEFPLSGTPPTMTHVFRHASGELRIGCKGALEGVLDLCRLAEAERQTILERSKGYARQGWRVLGVAKGTSIVTGVPRRMEDIQFDFLGLVTFHDPPVEGMDRVIHSFYRSGVDVCMITGDSAETALAVARSTGIRSPDCRTGPELEGATPAQFDAMVRRTRVFARISPALKLRLIEAFKERGEIVAMTGDGVNDAPALRAAHIGIAMGRRGTDVARAASALVLSDDDLARMTDAIAIGRRIRVNLTKAIRYIVSIHIPIILLVLMPILMAWLPDMLFTPVHVIFLELIMGPTCSIIYENEPVPEEEIRRPAQAGDKDLLQGSQLGWSMLQGGMITIGCLLAGAWTMAEGGGDAAMRTAVFVTLILSNVFLTLANRSFTMPVHRTLTRRNPLIPAIVLLSLALLTAMLVIPGLRDLFQLAPLPPSRLAGLTVLAAVFTLWQEPFKSAARNPLPGLGR
ncbi:MAG: cation-translocating P-type ATPase [Saprospiraceae bacterium]|nr:cation-translocating P-type ATPase [Saprospiraceae bacterium]